MPPWIVTVGKNEFIFNQPTFSQVVDDVVKHFASLLAPFHLTNDVVAFEGRCFAGPGAPTVTVLSEDSYTAFLEASKKFVPGQLPRVSLVDLRTGAPPPLPASPPPPSSRKHDPTSVAVPETPVAVVGASGPGSPAVVASSTAATSSSASVVASRLKNIQRVYDGLAASENGMGDDSTSRMALKQLSPTRRKATANKATRPVDAGDDAAEGDGGDSDHTDSRTISAGSLRAQMQRELEMAEQELRELENARATAAALGSARQGVGSSSSPPPYQISESGTPLGGRGNAVTSPGPQLMVWGTVVARGAAIPFSFSERLTLATLKQRCAAALQQRVVKLSYHTESSAPEVDLEDDSDVEVMCSVLASEGTENVTLTASADNDGPSGVPHSSTVATAAGSGLVSQAKLRREVRHSAHVASAATTSFSSGVGGGGGTAATSMDVTTPLTSPIKSVYAPSPFRNDATVTSGAAKAQSHRRPPSQSLIGSLD